MKTFVSTLALLALLAAPPVAAQDADMSFFITSRGSGNGADLGGLEGADQLCQDLAYAVGFGDLTWRAYLSAISMGGEAAVNARDRIGDGPWYNYEGELIAESVEALHGDDANLTKESILTERGGMVNGRGDSPNRHDILTGTGLDGRVYDANEAGYDNCGNFTSTAGDGMTRVGHHDRTGGGENPTSWNSAHNSRGCSQENLEATGGDGRFYCFAVDAQQQEQQALREE